MPRGTKVFGTPKRIGKRKGIDIIWDRAITPSGLCFSFEGHSKGLHAVTTKTKRGYPLIEAGARFIVSPTKDIEFPIKKSCFEE